MPIYQGDIESKDGERFIARFNVGDIAWTLAGILRPRIQAFESRDMTFKTDEPTPTPGHRTFNGVVGPTSLSLVFSDGMKADGTLNEPIPDGIPVTGDADMMLFT